MKAIKSITNLSTKSGHISFANSDATSRATSYAESALTVSDNETKASSFVDEYFENAENDEKKKKRISFDSWLKSKM